MATAIDGNILGKAEQEFGQLQIRGKSELGKEDFLTLLVAQLSHQDPMNPMDDKEFVSQLSEFSSLEQLTNISGGIKDMNDSTARQEMISAVSFIGKDVRAKGYGLSKQNDSTSSLYFTITEPVANGFINIYDPNMNLVRTESIGTKQPGNYEYQWDGKDYKGTNLADGVYSVAMYAEGLDGNPVLVSTEVSGKVAGVQKDGTEQYLRLADGRVVRFTDVQEVVDTSSSSNTDETTPSGQ
ncbi:flagellar hook assembly protein FlgD [Desulfovibrio mangrovi]|uniref:flagellar hook assembly protein FlgD n=1 Tax=Desulfovibrio mangrovi TaxID=2976983 RepID=UPI002248312F|nr:flagellar hook assembly protein FlgD [Desulfovibrio mangrovi]UZP68180.1 flagellar hook assembly protein FlgD [Desulfovibrio mangrovi]